LTSYDARPALGGVLPPQGSLRQLDGELSGGAGDGGSFSIDRRLRWSWNTMINCKSQAELDKMRRSGQIVHQCLDMVKAMVGPGVSTIGFGHTAEEKIRELGAKRHFKGYTIIPVYFARP